MGRPRSVLSITGTWNLGGCTQSQCLCSDFPKVTLLSQPHRNYTPVDLGNIPNCTAHWNPGVLGAKKKNGGSKGATHVKLR